MSDEEILGNLSMTQPKVTTSQDESGRVIYHCTIEVYNVRTGDTEMKFTGSNPDEVQACVQAASQGFDAVSRLCGRPRYPNPVLCGQRLVGRKIRDG
jgi:hypothetical protein